MTEFPLSPNAVSPALRPIEDAYPLTRMQQGLLVRCLSYPDRPLYMGQWWAVFEGDLDERAFAAAWQGVIERHTALRSGFHWDLKDHPFQVVHRQAALAVGRDDWSGDPDWRGRLERFLAEDRARPFDLRKPPLMRVASIRLAPARNLPARHLPARHLPARHLIVWTRHHLTVDGWSLGLILDELFALYKALRGGRTHSLLPAPAYRAYVDWERSTSSAAALDHWRGVLGGIAPDDRAAIGGSRVTGETAPDIRETGRDLPASLAARLDAFARSARVTQGTLVQAGWAIVESRLTGNDMVLFGAVETVRPPQLVPSGSTEPVGMQIRLQPVLARLDETPLHEWLERLQAAAVAARDAGTIGMDELRDLLGLPHDRLPFDGLVGVQNYPLDEAEAVAGSGLTLAESGDVTLPDMPLNLMVERQGGGLRLRLIFDHRRLGAQEAGLRLDMMVAALTALPDSAAVPVCAIDALPAATAAALLGPAFCGPPLVMPEPTMPGPAMPARTVVAMIIDHARARPDAPAVVQDGRRVTYAGLVAMAGAVAGRLAERGIGRGDRVGLRLERTPLALAAILGTMLRGASYVPFDPDLPDDRAAFMSAEAGLAGLLTDRAGPGGTASDIAIGDIAIGDIAIGDFGQDGGATPAGPEAWCLPAPSDEAYVIFTSGSTGRPKGVSVGHDNLAYHVAARRAAFPDQSFRAVLLTFPLAFDGSVTGIFSALANGGSLVLPRPVEAADPDRLAALIRTEGVTHVFMIPSQWDLLLSAGTPADLAGLEMAVVAGEACPRDLVDRHAARLPGTRLCNEYGPTETTIWATLERCVAGGTGPVAIGRPIPGARAYVSDRRNRLCPPGTVGELLIAGPGVARGYVGRPDRTAERFTANPFHDEAGFRTVYRTGDQAAFGFDGRLWFHGRADDQVKISGHRIELAEIGACLRDLPGVDDAIAVLHRAGPRAPPRILAHVAGTDPPDQDAILRHARRRLPAYMVPQCVVLHGRLPRTATGKIDRRRLPEPSLPQLAAAPPEGPAEQAIAGVWQAVLGCGAVGRFDDFFAIGGGSLAAMQVVSRLRRELGLAADLIDLFEAPRLGDFACRLAGRDGRQSPAIHRRQRTRVDLAASTAPEVGGR